MHSSSSKIYLMSQKLQDLIQIICCSLFIFILFYIIHKCFKTNERSRSWIVSAISSFILTISGLIWVIRYLFSIEQFTKENIYSDNAISRLVVIFFLSTNVVDLIIGYFYYYSQQSILTSYIHHAFYLMLTTILLLSQNTNGFIYCFFEEFPTFVLAIGFLFPRLRSDLLFGVSFFIFRIVFHMILTYKYYRCMNDSIYWKFSSLVTILHWFWMYKWTISMFKEKKLKSEIDHKLN